MNRNHKDRLFFGITLLATIISCSILIGLMTTIMLKGMGAINPEFLLTQSKQFGAQGGIFYQIVGSLILIGGAALVAYPLALGTAICYSEFINNPTIKKITGTLIYGLNGIPSIVYGIFGLIFFVNFLKTGIAWYVGSLILAFMILPTLIIATYQSMNSIPKIYRESSLALGHSKWQTIVNVIIPQSFSGSLTGLLLGLARAIGETAPIMFIATVFSGVLIPSSINQPVTALPTHILELAKQATNPSALQNAWGAALTLIIIVFILTAASYYARIKLKTISQR